MRISDYIDADLLDRFEFYNYNHAIEIITQAFPKEWSDVVECLRKLDITTDDLREAGGNETKIPKKFDDVLYPCGWREIRISGDLHIKFYPRQADQRGRFSSVPFEERVTENYIDGHNIDFLKGRIAFDLEWNSKDQTFDRDLLAMRTYYDCDIVSAETLSGSCVTDGYHDMGIDAVYNDSTQKKLVLVQSKWRRDGTGGISQEEAGSFAQGVKRIINSEFEGCNAKISAKQTDIIAALKDMDYQIEVIFCHTGNQCITDYSKRPITDLLKQVNEEDVAEILVFKEIKLQDIYDFLASSQALDDITIDDVMYGLLELWIHSLHRTSLQRREGNDWC